MLYFLIYFLEYFKKNMKIGWSERKKELETKK